MIKQWRMASGSYILIKQMENSHVANVLAKLREVQLKSIITNKPMHNYHVQCLKAFEHEIELRSSQFDPVPEFESKTSFEDL